MVGSRRGSDVVSQSQRAIRSVFLKSVPSAPSNSWSYNDVLIVYLPRCSPVQFMGPARVTPPPCNIADLPPIDAVIISHNHYDHLDLNTIKQLAKPETWFFVPLGNKQWFLDIGITNVVECDWWDEYKLEVQKDGVDAKAIIGAFTLIRFPSVRFLCSFRHFTAATPCQHFTGRSLTDRYKTLWSSWVVEANDTSMFFGGDTGYRTVQKGFTGDLDSLPHCPAFKVAWLKLRFSCGGR